jgi:hypothetical protein
MGWNYGYDAGRAVEQALDKKAENARELGLDYEPEQELVAIEHCIWARNGNTPCPHTSPLQREWVGLTDEERDAMIGVTDLSGTYYYDDLYAVILLAEGKLKEKNATAQPVVPDAIGPNEDELPSYAAGWNDCRQAMLEMRKP